MNIKIQTRHGHPTIAGCICTYETKKIRKEIMDLFLLKGNFLLPPKYTFELINAHEGGQVAKISLKEKPNHKGEMLHDHINEIIAGGTGNISDFYPEKISDGFHTFEELYNFRTMYNALLFNEWYRTKKHQVHKSKRHQDGEFPFDRDDMFIVGAMLPGIGQITNHYNIKDWELFDVLETKKFIFKFDGHTSYDCLNRMERLISLNSKRGDNILLKE